MKKNDIVEVTITDMGADGEGIGKVNGFTLFIKDGIIGDVLEVKIIKLKKHYGYARMMKILTPSKYRVEPLCPIARRCGGCQIQELKYEEQLAFKQNKVRNHLIRIGKFEEELITRVMDPIAGMEQPFYYRNKAQFPIGTDKEGNIITGFYAGRTHDIIPNKKCYLGVDVNETILDLVIGFMEQYKIQAYDEKVNKGLVRHVLIRYGFATKEIMVCIIINGKTLPHSEELVKALKELPGMTSITLNINEKNTNVIMGHQLEVLWGQGYISDKIGDITYQISPLSFYQVNPVQTKVMYDKVVEYADVKKEDVVWDLYCGIGTISLYLAQYVKEVHGVEIIPQAIEDAKKNSHINGIENAYFYVGKAEDVVPKKYKEEGIHADVIIVDPPRKGCDETLLDTILSIKPRRVVYVSCDSATLARDLQYLCERDYELKKVQVVDNFGNTVHVETVVLMSRKDK